MGRICLSKVGSEKNFLQLAEELMEVAPDEWGYVWGKQSDGSLGGQCGIVAYQVARALANKHGIEGLPPVYENCKGNPGRDGISEEEAVEFVRGGMNGRLYEQDPRGAIFRVFV